VLIPQFHEMTEQDVAILPKLSKHLREELTTEKNCHIICVHPFFEKVKKNKAAISKICNSGLVHVPVARGDVVFALGQVARWMLWVTSGTLDYIPHGEDNKLEQLTTGRWLCEAALWSTWITQGQLQGAEESSGVELDAVTFRNTMRENPMYASYARKYAHAFLAELNRTWKDTSSLPSDNQEEVTMNICNEGFFKNNSISSGNLGTTQDFEDTVPRERKQGKQGKPADTQKIIADIENKGAGGDDKIISQL